MNKAASSSSSFHDNDDDTSLGRALENCIYREDIDGARQLVENLNAAQRTALGRHHLVNGDGLLPYVVRYRRALSLVGFLLDECHVDVEQLSGPDTPLCLAARYRLDDVVPLLIDHGANVNAPGHRQRTPLHVASCGNDINLVRYLVERGADTQQPDVDGMTCLMCSIQHRSGFAFAISRYLILQGASVNARDERGEAALHYALLSPRTSVRRRFINLLLRHGADPSIRNLFGDDALQTAALYGAPQIIDHLIDRLHPTASRCADLYSLVAARYVDEVGNFEGAVDLWKEAANIRLSDDEPMPDPNPVYGGAVEARDMQSLDALAYDRDALYMQALVCRERILGTGHCKTIQWLSQRALFYARSNAFQRGIELYKYATVSCGPASLNQYMDMYVHQTFVKLLRAEMKNNVSSVRFDDAAAALRMMVGKSKRVSVNERYMAQQILRTAIDAVDLLCRLKSSVPESLCLRQLARELVQSSCGKTPDFGNALHVALHLCTYQYTFAGHALVKERLEAGADVNGSNCAGDTPLHLATLRIGDYRGTDGSELKSRLDLVNLLLRRGAHADLRNNAGQIAAERLPAGVDKMSHTSLQCLAARTIRQYRVAYDDILPSALVDFVRRH